jgi:tetratricopeptide (TPR) repeat protein
LTAYNVASVAHFEQGLCSAFQSSIRHGHHDILRAHLGDAYRLVTHGHLGQCLFQLGDAEAARAPTEQALPLCEATGDHDGVLAYLGNLYELHRYRGDAGAAADCLDRRSAALELRRYAEAVESYRRTEALAPGWYHCRGDRWLAERLAAGDVDHAVFQAVCQLVDDRMAPDQAVALAEAALARCELGEARLALVELGCKAEAEAACTDEPDVRARLLVALGNAMADRAERRRLLHAAIELSGNLVSGAMATILLASAPGAN